MTPRQGDVWLANLSPVAGNEQAGTRPVVVVASDQYMRMPIDLTIVVPVTSRDRRLPHHIRVADGLNRPSWAMTEAVRSVSTRRLVHRLGRTSRETLEAIVGEMDRWLELPALDDDEPPAQPDEPGSTP